MSPLLAKTLKLLFVTMFTLLLAVTLILLIPNIDTLSVGLSITMYILDESAYALKLPATAPISVLLCELSEKELLALSFISFDAKIVMLLDKLFKETYIFELLAERDTLPVSVDTPMLLLANMLKLLLALKMELFELKVVKLLFKEDILKNILELLAFTL